MSTIEFVSLLSMSGLYVFAGISHFRKPEFFLKITPPWVAFPLVVNFIVGGIEIILGMALLFNYSRTYAAIGIMALLVAIFPANIYHFQKAKRKGKHIVPTLFRLPLQAVLIYWAYSFI